MSIRRGSIRRLYSSLLVLAVLLRASIPDGFMPDVRHSGMAHMMICPGMAGNHHESGKTQDHHFPCPFTLLVTPNLPELAAVVPVAPVYIQAAEFEISTLTAQAAIKPWQSRGPPSLLTFV